MREESDMTWNWVRGCLCAMFCSREALYALRYVSAKSGKIGHLRDVPQLPRLITFITDIVLT